MENLKFDKEIAALLVIDPYKHKTCFPCHEHVKARDFVADVGTGTRYAP